MNERNMSRDSISFLATKKHLFGNLELSSYLKPKIECACTDEIRSLRKKINKLLRKLQAASDQPLGSCTENDPTSQCPEDCNRLGTQKRSENEAKNLFIFWDPKKDTERVSAEYATVIQDGPEVIVRQKRT